ncbi:MAG: hypothetical protein HUJ29_05190 [Gammaproteobacteria bacterium]|nr:hypothetical protein [Gammaproteobacteria bacterium]
MSKLVMFYAEVDAIDDAEIDDEDREVILILVKQASDENNNFLNARRIAEQAGWHNVEVTQAGVVDPDIDDNEAVYLAKQSAMQFGYAILRYNDIFSQDDN